VSSAAKQKVLFSSAFFCFVFSFPSFCFALRGHITNSGWLQSGVITLVQGTITTVVAYFISFGFEKLSAV